MATKYFDKFPKILYTLDDRESGQLVPDIMRRVKITDEIKNNSAFFDFYDVKDGESPEQLAARLYGDPGLHWILLMVNEIKDPRFGWPMSEQELIQYIEGKYGVGTVYRVNRIEDEQNFFVTTYYILDQASTRTDRRRLLFSAPNDPQNFREQPIAHSPLPTDKRYVTNYEYESRINESKRRIKILKPEVVSAIVDSFEELITK
ncbi:MAG: hypothetical protein EBU90_07550 [Proteobacteria bacterium]|nr:hypothetical protein [Pseudomonadota bacterium]NBP13442.1 hypothetical protein [bacterium]